MKIYKCNVCKVFPVGEVYTCYQGHPVCGECRPTSKKCQRPNCKKKILPGRNLNLEDRIKTGKFECLHRSYGCNRLLKLQSYDKHLLRCKFRPYSCPGCKLHIPIFPTDFADAQMFCDENSATNNRLIHDKNDPWLSWEEPEKIEGVSENETVAMKPTTTTSLGRAATAIPNLFRGSNAFNCLITTIQPKRKNKIFLFPDSSDINM